MIVIGLTGGIGTGKTEVSKTLGWLGAEILDADSMGHKIYVKGSDAWQEVVDAFGKQILTPDGDIDRNVLGSVVFGCKKDLVRLNRIVHPRILLMLENSIRDLRDHGNEVVVVEVPLLLELGWVSIFDEIWVVTSSETLVIDRLTNERNLDVSSIGDRVNVQMLQKERVKHADVIIDNNGSLGDLNRRVCTVWRERFVTSSDKELEI